MALAPDGKIVVAGTSQSGQASAFTVTRYDSVGSPDASFDGDGVVVTSVGGASDTASSVAVEPDGKIVVAGSTSSGGNLDFALVRYLPDGSLDSSFGHGGKVVTPVGASTDEAHAAALQPDGKILVASAVFGSSNNDFGLVRYLANGALDASFGVGGKVTTPVGSGDDYAYSLAVQPDGRIVAAGRSGSDFAIVRYTQEGDLDPTFGNGGKVVTPVGVAGDWAFGVALQPDGKIVAAGFVFTLTGTGLDFALVRYHVDGALDASFGEGGIVVNPMPAPSDVAQDVAIQPDGKIVAAGWSQASGGAKNFTLTRYNADGSLDDGFGKGGVSSEVVGDDSEAYGLAIQSDGKIVVAGMITRQGQPGFGVARYESAAATETLRLGPGAVSISGSASLHASYTVPTGSGEQLRTAPVGRIDTISIAFPRGVVVAQDDLAVVGSTQGAYAIAGFSYDSSSYLATWTLSQPLEADRVTLTLQDDVTDSEGQRLDGEWDNPSGLDDLSSSSESGDGSPGGDFSFHFTVLPGDANRDNRVDGGDFVAVIDHWDGRAGAADKVFVDGDFTGDGHVDGADLTLWADAFGAALLAPPSESPAQGAASAIESAEPVAAPLATRTARRPAIPRRPI